MQMQPKAQYDIIGDKYLLIRSSLKVFEVLEYTLFKQLNFKLSGERVIDLACGSGICTRAIKKMGAGKTVGVDISKEMIAKALNEEQINPLGIEYIVASVDEMKIESGSFDIATAFFLLPYAKNKKQLELFLKNIHSSLKTGGTFFSINNNLDKNLCMNPRNLQQYGIVYNVEEPSQTGSSVIVSLSAGDVNVDLQIWYYTQEDYIEAAKMAGFAEVEFLPLEFPEHMKGAPYWDGFNQYNTFELMICKK